MQEWIKSTTLEFVGLDFLINGQNFRHPTAPTATDILKIFVVVDSTIFNSVSMSIQRVLLFNTEWDYDAFENNPQDGKCRKWKTKAKISRQTALNQFYWWCAYSSATVFSHMYLALLFWLHDAFINSLWGLHCVYSKWEISKLFCFSFFPAG